MSDILQIVFFLLWVNALPPLVALLLHPRFELAVDGNRFCADGRPLLGHNKTFRGVVAGIAGGMVVAPLLGLSWWAGGLGGLLAMIGDLLSSFCKRRSGIDCGSSAFLLDQLFESLLPLLFFNIFFSLTISQNLAILMLFILTAYATSSLWLYITERPLPQPYPRTVQSTVRFQEWRSCHTPLARWQVWFNLTSFLSDQILLTWLFKITGLYSLGQRNALAIRREEVAFTFPDLPEDFDGFRILFLADLHLDGLEDIDLRLTAMLREIEADLCLVGGDLRMKTYGDSAQAITRLRQIRQYISTPYGIFGVLGNHDCIEMLPDLEDAGLIMLVNDATTLERGTSCLWLAGVDDPHYYRLDDASQATSAVPENGFTLFLAHSPEAYREAAANGAQLYLCGHTHGGQICLAEGVPIVTNSRAPRFTASGRWNYGGMQGYTSRGVAPSSIPVRFNCPGEVSLITLKKS